MAWFSSFYSNVIATASAILFWILNFGFWMYKVTLALLAL